MKRKGAAVSRRRLIRRVNRWARYISHYRHISKAQCGGRGALAAITALEELHRRRRHHG